MKIVISVGGSLLYPKEIDFKYIKKFSNFVNVISKKHKLALVTGGGKLAREYIQIARNFKASEFFCDLLGIEATKMNALILKIAIGEKANFLETADFIQVTKALEDKKIVVMGGTYPGHSTDAVAAILAEFINANLLINATDVDGIYNKNPKKYKKDAKLYKKISTDELIDITKTKSLGAGKYELIDILAVKIIQRSKINCIFLNGKNLENMKKVIEGKDFIGTTIENK